MLLNALNSYLCSAYITSLLSNYEWAEMLGKDTSQVCLGFPFTKTAAFEQRAAAEVPRGTARPDNSAQPQDAREWSLIDYPSTTTHPKVWAKNDLFASQKVTVNF